VFDEYCYHEACAIEIHMLTIMVSAYLYSLINHHPNWILKCLFVTFEGLYFEYDNVSSLLFSNHGTRITATI